MTTDIVIIEYLKHFLICFFLQSLSFWSKRFELHLDEVIYLARFLFELKFGKIKSVIFLYHGKVFFMEY